MTIEFTHDWDCNLVPPQDGVRVRDWVYTGERLEGCACVKAALAAYWAAQIAADVEA
jgi:hypothetical protein